MPLKAHTKRTINAPKKIVWEILDDFPTIASWSAGIQQSFTTGDTSLTTGLGAERRCELGGKKVLDERISAYTAGESMTIDVWNVEGLPLLSSQVTFAVQDLGNGQTEARIDAVAVPKIPGFIVKIVGPIMSRVLAKNFSGLLDELATASEQALAAQTVGAQD